MSATDHGDESDEYVNLTLRVPKQIKQEVEIARIQSDDYSYTSYFAGDIFLEAWDQYKRNHGIE